MAETRSHRERRLARAAKRGGQLRARRERVAPRHIKMLRRGEPVPAEWAGALLDAAADENRDLLEALGGADEVSPQRRAMIGDVSGGAERPSRSSTARHEFS
jgi:hypothetical protein